ncbi:MAG: ORC1-type DNA replication protein [Candidatus Aenigmarchaeota archaeon]|nr:ORC1-type DNA replication protein [Candidatus Aenigmarchaeota archaeon]
MPQTNLQSIFQNFIKSPTKIFKDRNALSVNFTPSTIPHREKQIETLATILAPSLKGSKPSNVFIYGTTGTGKTVVTKYVTQELEKISLQSLNPVKILYVNCKMKKVADTEYRLIAELCRLLGQEVPFTGLPTEQLYHLFFKLIDARKWVVIIVLDEIDALVKKIGDEFLYNFTRINQELKNAKVSFIGITNDLNLIQMLDPRVKSSLGEEEMLFPPYNALELQDILKQRAKLAFYDGVLEEDVIPKCAALAAQEHGDARKALDLLRVAGEIAERQNESKVTSKHVDMARKKLAYERIVEAVKTLPKHSKAVFWAIIKTIDEKKESVQTGDVYKFYEDVCKNTGLSPLTQRRVSDLIAELDMLGLINGRVISKGRYGRTREITLNLASDVEKKVRELLKTEFESD